MKLLTDLQILGCELHKNAFGGRAPPGPAGGAIALPRPPSRYKVEGRVRKWLGTEYISPGACISMVAFTHTLTTLMIL